MVSLFIAVNTINSMSGCGEKGLLLTHFPFTRLIPLGFRPFFKGLLRTWSILLCVFRFFQDADLR